MFSLKTALATALVATVTSPWNAKGINDTSATPKDGKEPPRLIEGPRIREIDTYDLNESQAKLLAEIHALNKGRRPDQLFSTALSDSAIVRQSNGNAWLIRVFYPPEDHSPWMGTVWIAKLTVEELPGFPTRLGGPPSQGPSIFTISEVVPVSIPKGLAGFMEPFRATKAVVWERRLQLESMWISLDEMIQNTDGAEEVVRKQAEIIRKYGPCCPGESDGEQSNEELARKMERYADEAPAKRAKLIQARDSLRSVILLQPATKQKPESEAPTRSR